MTVPRPATLLCALLLGLVCAFATACGQDDSKLLSGSRADLLRQDLDAVESAIATGRCTRARQALDDLDGHVGGIPGETDRGLRQRLREGVERLRQQVPEACEANRPETTDTEPEETVPEETVPEETVPEETVPEETVPEETVPEETVPEEPVPEEPVPEDPGGTEAPEGGFVPPGQVGKDDG